MAYLATGGLPKAAFKGLESSFVGGVGGVERLGAKYAPKAPSAGRQAWRFVSAPFRAAPKVTPRPSAVLTTATQAGDDAVRAVTQIAPSAPAAGRAGTQQFPTAFVVKAGVVGAGAAGAVYAAPSIGRALSNVGGGIGAGAGAAVQQPLSGLGVGLADAFAGLGAGLANTLAGVGAGTGAGVSSTLGGVGEGLKKVAGPALLLGGAALIAFAVVGRVGAKS